MIGFVYLITDGNYFKIGYTTKKLEYRLKELQVGNPSQLSIIHFHKTFNFIKIEYLLHRRFHHKHILGEWFDLTTDDTDNFISKCLLLEDEIEVMKNNPFY